MAKPSARIVTNDVGWAVGVEVWQDGQWQPADYDYITVDGLLAEQDALTEFHEAFDSWAEGRRY